MKLGIIDGSTVKTVGDHTQLFPNTSFPRTSIPASFLTENNAKEVKIPTYDTKTQKLNEISPVIDGDYIKEYEVLSLTTEEKTEIDNQQWNIVRQDRNTRLQSSDWTQITDSPLTDEKKTEWQTYRQSLRDITKQSDPFNITWPNNPNNPNQEDSDESNSAGE